MANLLLAVIYVAFISLGLPDAVLGAAWPTMGTDLNAPVSWEGGPFRRAPLCPRCCPIE